MRHASSRSTWEWVRLHLYTSTLIVYALCMLRCSLANALWHSYGTICKLVYFILNFSIAATQHMPHAECRAAMLHHFSFSMFALRLRDTLLFLIWSQFYRRNHFDQLLLLTLSLFYAQFMAFFLRTRNYSSQATNCNNDRPHMYSAN